MTAGYFSSPPMWCNIKKSYFRKYDFLNALCLIKKAGKFISRVAAFIKLQYHFELNVTTFQYSGRFLNFLNTTFYTYLPLHNIYLLMFLIKSTFFFHFISFWSLCIDFFFNFIVFLNRKIYLKFDLFFWQSILYRSISIVFS